ncbi:MAG TPA: hypothetical protein VKA36_05365 [Solirubrobacterales bacterium]|nr:hypothetical protein [Solirubrobacterales bacterium]
MRRPWLDRRSRSDADREGSPEISDLTGALRARLDALRQAAQVAAEGIEGDHERYRQLVGATVDDSGADALVAALKERMRKIEGEAEAVGTLLQRYAEIAEAAAGEAEDVGKAKAAGGDSAAAALRWESEGAAGTPADAGAPDRPVAASSDIEVPEGIRLLATQMSTSGASRGEIERRLSEDFGVTNAPQVVAKLFGG